MQHSLFHNGMYMYDKRNRKRAVNLTVSAEQTVDQLAPSI